MKKNEVLNLNLNLKAIVLIVAVIAIIIAFGEKNLISKKTNTKTIEKSYPIYDEKVLIEKLYNKVKLVSYTKENEIVYNYYYEQDSLNTKDMDRRYKLSLAYQSVDKYDIAAEKLEENSYKYILKEQDLKDAYENLFGSLDDYSAQDFSAGCITYTYSKDDKYYYWEGFTCGANEPIYEASLTDYSINNGIIELTEKVTKEEGETYYKYTIIESAGKYYFKSVELVS